jgi:FMN phosphatase YigB (HAD superfamily)
MKKYSTIVFDLGNTLIRFDHNISARKVANLCHLDSKKIYDAFFDSEITRAFEKGALAATARPVYVFSPRPGGSGCSLSPWARSTSSAAR